MSRENLIMKYETFVMTHDLTYVINNKFTLQIDFVVETHPAYEQLKQIAAQR